MEWFVTTVNYDKNDPPDILKSDSHLPKKFALFTLFEAF